MRKLWIWIIAAVAVAGMTAIVFIFFVPWGSAKSEVNKTQVEKSDSLVKSSSGKMINNLNTLQGTFVSHNTKDKTTSEIFFQVEGMQETIGKFKDFSIEFTGGEKPSVKVSIQASSIFTDNEYRDEHLMGEGFFETEKFSTIDFASSEITIGDTSYTAKGEITFLGKKATLDVPVSFIGKGKYNDGKEFAAFEGRFSFDRIKFGMAEDASIGNVASVWFYAELVKK